ncbi:hypothetical protein G6011_06083 [Alternaria panax]|uniref:Uncharacterized protein n=1 Tax=Alternaria panax TaxID=48097 RepID=A0AAD4FH02_9PLEO|nr:hypothetical protein G6011_06083 [Alternaria panax]
MGASHSTPPPLVEVNVARGKVLVGPGTAFTVHPPSYARSRSDPYTRGPVYTPCPSPFRGVRQHQQRPRPRPHPRFERPDIDILEESEGSESTDLGMMEGMSPRGMRRQMSKGYPGGMMGGGGMPSMEAMEAMGRRGGLGGFDGMDLRPRSAPEMQMGGYPGLGGMPTGVPGSPRMGDMGGVGGMGGMGPGGMGGMGAMGGMQPSGMPPAYTSNTSMPRFGMGGGMPSAGMNPYTNQAGPASSHSSSRSSPDPPQATRRGARKISKHYEHIPKGAYASAEKAGRKSRSRADPQTSACLNRGQPWNKQVGHSGGELLGGDAFLDACICTTACNCRKSERVIYLARNDPRKGSDSDEEDYTYGSGEIRYILKTDLGKDCGDHSGCKKSSDSDSDKDQKSKKKKDKKEEKKRKDQFDEFKDDILEALDERLQDLKKDSQQQGRSESSPARQAFGGPGVGPNAFMMNDMNMDPRLAQQMGMMAGDRYGTGRMPPGMADPTSRRPMHPSRAMGSMGGIGGGMGPTGIRGFENDMSDMDDMGMMENPCMQSVVMNKKGMRPNFMSHRGAKTGRQFSNGGMGMDMNVDQMTSMYAKAMGGGRGGTMMGGGRGGGGRRAHLESESDHFDLGPVPSMRSGMRQQAGRDRAGRGSRRPGNEANEVPIRRDFGGSPLGRNNGSQDRGKQPRVDTDDDDAY